MKFSSCLTHWDYYWNTPQQSFRASTVHVLTSFMVIKSLKYIRSLASWSYRCCHAVLTIVLIDILRRLCFYGWWYLIFNFTLISHWSDVRQSCSTEGTIEIWSKFISHFNVRWLCDYSNPHFLVNFWLWTYLVSEKEWLARDYRVVDHDPVIFRFPLTQR